MKYNFNLKNVQIQNVASVEELEVNVEYSVGEIPEILGHVLPFIERLTGEILPKLADKFVDTRAKIDQFDEAKREARAAERIAEQMAEKLVADRAHKTFSDSLEEAGFEHIQKEQSVREERRTADSSQEGSHGMVFSADSQEALDELLQKHFGHLRKAGEVFPGARSADGSFWR